MLYHYTGTVPANTAELAPFHEKLSVTAGTIVLWIPFMPEEDADLVKFWVEYHGIQLFPWNREEWAFGFFVPIPIPEKLTLDIPPYELDFWAVNEDDTYEHEFNLYIDILPKQPVAATPTISPFLADLLNRILGV